MNAKVKGMAFSVLTAMFILALTAGTAYAACGGFDQSGYVRYGDGSEVTDLHENYNMTITNLNTSDTWIKGIAGPGGYTLTTWSGSGYYKLTSTRPLASPYDDRTCLWIAGDVAEYKVWSLDGTVLYSNTSYHTMTDADMIAATCTFKDVIVKGGDEITFEKELAEGWNLISLPLTPSPSNSTSSVLSSMAGKYDAVYNYDAVTKDFVDVSSGTMDPSIGYFVHVTTAGTWTYNGFAYTSMNVPLEQGLNMVGWHNCTKTIGTESGDALYSIKDSYYYAARWNAGTQEFKTYNPVAPNEFNDFSDMERGEGYFISAKGVDTLSESC